MSSQCIEQRCIFKLSILIGVPPVMSCFHLPICPKKHFISAIFPLLINERRLKCHASRLNGIWRVQHSQALAILQGGWPAARLQTQWGDGEKKINSSYEKKKHFWNGFKASLSAQSRQKAASEPRSSKAPKKPDTRVSPQQTKETLRPRLDVNDVLLDYSGELGVMMRWCGSSERERHKDVPRSVPPTCSVGHVGGKANVCVWVYA